MSCMTWYPVVQFGFTAWLGCACLAGRTKLYGLAAGRLFGHTGKKSDANRHDWCHPPPLLEIALA